MVRQNKFSKILRLRKAVEFKSVYERGAKRTSRSFVVFIVANGLPHSRFGLTTPRRLGAAHDRNRIRRRVREILRTSKSELPPGLDVVLNPRRSAGERGFADLKMELISLLEASR